MAKLKRKKGQWTRGRAYFSKALGGNTVEVVPFKKGRLTVRIVKEARVGWHVSVAHETRMPTMEEIQEARNLVAEDVCMAMVMPHGADLHGSHTIFLHQVEDAPYAQLSGLL